MKAGGRNRQSSRRILPRVYYTPLEAAIHWSGLLAQEEKILATMMRGNTQLESLIIPKWPHLQLNLERILDAIRQHELPIRSPDPKALPTSPEHSRYSIRHLDLKSWMGRYYPECRPPFLFGPLSEALQPDIPIEAVHALLTERDALRSQIAMNAAQIDALRSRSPPKVSSGNLGPRGETTYLHILGALLTLMLGRTPSGQPHSLFRSQESIIHAMVAEHGGRQGISERTLEQKFAAARKALGK